MNKHFWVAVDGGGTGVRVRAYLPDGSVIGQGESGPASLTLGVDIAWQHIKKALYRATLGTAYERTMPIKMLAGLAGSRNQRQCKSFLRLVEKEMIDCLVVSDAYTSAVGALSGHPVIVIAIGTGLGACAINTKGQIKYVSGWGFKVGDEGAGSWIGLQAVTAYLKYIDGRMPQHSEMYPMLSEVIGKQANTIQQWCLKATATDFAALAKPISMLANQKSPLALEIMCAAAEEIFQVINVFDADMPIVLQGGLADAMLPYLPEVAKRRIRQAEGTALDGAEQLLFSDVPAGGK